MTLGNKSLTQLRGIAQSLDIPDIFQKDIPQLLQAIEVKQSALAPTPKIEIPKPEYDARLMTEEPAKLASCEELNTLLSPYIERGLKLTYDEERWYMSYGRKTDEGTLRMPLKTALKCADKLME